MGTTTKIEDLRNLSNEELRQKADSLKADLYGLRYQAKSGRIEKPHRMKLIRRDIARINTIIRERELKNAVNKT
jgi:large subunit ribosomal protein L29